jgi:O-antigen/teichoic acid export membrane protein
LHRAWKRICVTAPNKILGTLQTQSQPFLIGVFLGPASAAVYDVLMRLPRFAKATLGLMNSAVIPFISKLEAEDRKRDVTKVAENGFLWISYLSFPPLFAAATFSEPLLDLWIGKEIKSYWFWQSIAFSTPLITVLLGFGFNSLFGRTHVYKILNKFVIIRILLQYAISIALMSLLAEKAFVLGGVAAVAATAFWEFKLIFKEHKISRLLVKKLLSISFIGIFLTLIFLPLATMIHSVIWLFISLSLYSSLFWVMAWFFVIPKHTKKSLLKVLNLKRLVKL